MYTKEIQTQFFKSLKEYVDNPVSELMERSGYGRSTINRFLNFQSIKPSTLDTLIELTIEIVAERQQKRQQIIEKGLALNHISFSLKKQ